MVHGFVPALGTDVCHHFVSCYDGPDLHLKCPEQADVVITI
jgi:hypothetical protein